LRPAVVALEADDKSVRTFRSRRLPAVPLLTSSTPAEVLEIPESMLNVGEYVSLPHMILTPEEFDMLEALICRSAWTIGNARMYVGLFPEILNLLVLLI
jgi:hypothetical protein